MRKSLKNFKEIKNATENSDDMLKKYGNMSEDALFEKLMQSISASKSNGTFSYEELKANVEKMIPYLSDVQKEKLAHILRLIGS